MNNIYITITNTHSKHINNILKMNWVKLTAMDKSENNSGDNLQKVTNKNENDKIVSKIVKPATTIKVILKQKNIILKKIFYKI